MHIIIIGLNHKTAPLIIREKFAFSTRELKEAYAVFKEFNMQGSVILNTCNRTEFYFSSRDISEALNILYNFLVSHTGLSINEIKKYVYFYQDQKAVKHLYKVASGLDSMILGETQILGQIKDAYQRALEAETTNGIINYLFQHALGVGKKVRAETKIDQKAVSISYAAVELAKKYFCDLRDKVVLVLGAGKMSQLAVKYLTSCGIKSIIVSNRSYDKACLVANELGGKAIRFDKLATYFPQADIIISCTGAPSYILRKNDIMPWLNPTKKLLLIDIALPRDIEPEIGLLDNVILKDIDDLKENVVHNLQARKKIALIAEKIILEEIEEFFNWFNSLYIIPVIVSLKEKTKKIKEIEFAKAMKKLSRLSSKEKKIVECMANSIANKIIHDPIVNLRENATSGEGHFYAEALQDLLNLPMEAEELEKVNYFTERELEPTQSKIFKGD